MIEGEKKDLRNAFFDIVNWKAWVFENKIDIDILRVGYIRKKYEFNVTRWYWC